MDKKKIAIIGGAIALFVAWKIISGTFGETPNEGEAKVLAEKQKMQEDLLKTYDEPSMSAEGDAQALTSFEEQLGARSEPEKVVQTEQKPVLFQKKLNLSQVPSVDAPKPQEPAKQMPPANMGEAASTPTNAFENALVDEAGSVKPTVNTEAPRRPLGEIVASLPATEEVGEVDIKGKQLRDKLKTLLASAEKTVDSEKAMLPAGESGAQNSVAVKAKDSKEMLRDLVDMAVKSGSQSDTRYVETLLSEVSKAKISVIGVSADSTTIVVKSGDTLSKMASEFYDDSLKYRIIFEANQDVLTNPNRIYPGMVLKLPKL